jgi:hypothetical protein
MLDLSIAIEGSEKTMNDALVPSGCERCEKRITECGRYEHRTKGQKLEN